MKKGDLIFVRNNGWLFNRIRQVTNSEFDHLALCISDSHLIEATPTRGVARAFITKYDSTTHSVCRFNDEYKSNIDTLVSYCESKLGRKYDLLQVISLYILILLGIKTSTNPLDIREAFVCSELVGQGAEEAGIIFADGVATDRLTPGDIYNSDKLEKII